MPKGSGQKVKLYYLSRILIEKTDDDHWLTASELISELEEYGVEVERKSLYDDMETLRELGLDIIRTREGRDHYYHVGAKHFELAELKLLVDAIQSSKFITEKKSRNLIKKLTYFVSEYEADQLNRQVMVQGRVKTMNESIYLIVDDIHRAMADNKNITFKYMKWNADKEMVPRKDKLYEVSPWALIWDDENYYMVAYDEEADAIKHYRVDKIRSIEISDNKRRGRDHFRESDLARYNSMNFGMFGGEIVRVRLQFKEELVGVMIDRFGKEIPVNKSKQKGWLETNVEVALSDQFFGWIFGLGNGVQITGPKSVVTRFSQELNEIRKMYS